MNGNGKVRAQSFRDLIVWQKGIQLTTAIYQVTNDLPREELYGLTTQLRRSAVSIPAISQKGKEG
jgi:four helix bundle protein